MAVDKSPEAFRTISEVGEDLDLPQHVLRFWETRFAQIRPLKRGGGRRYYRPDDVDLLKGIRHYLYGEGYTIRGVQRILKDRGVRHVVEMGRAQAENYAPPVAVIPRADEAEARRARAAEWPEASLRAPERIEPVLDGAEPEPTPHLAPLEAFVDPPATEPPVRPALSREDAHRLRTALIALGECRRLLDGAG